MSNDNNIDSFYEDVTDTSIQTGMKVVYHYNPSQERDGITLSNGKDIGRGFFGAKVSSAPWMFGDVVTVPFGSNNEDMVVNTELKNIAILSMDAPTHQRWVVSLFADNKAQLSKRIADMLPPTMPRSKDKSDGWTVKAYGYIFFVFLDDPDLAIHALHMSGTVTRKSLDAIQNDYNVAAARGRNYLATTPKGAPKKPLQKYAFGANLEIGPKVKSEGIHTKATGFIAPIVTNISKVKDIQSIFTGAKYLVLSQKAAELLEALANFDQPLFFRDIAAMNANNPKLTDNQRNSLRLASGLADDEQSLDAAVKRLGGVTREEQDTFTEYDFTPPTPKKK